MTTGPSDHDAPPPGSAGLRPEAMSSLLKELLLQGTARDQASRGEAKPGAMVGRFELVRELGRGGFGVVYEARDVQLQRSVAVKLLRIGEAGLGEQLQREAELVARLSHPNLVTLFDVGLSPQGPYLVLELLKGQTLQQRLDAGPMPAAEAVHIAVEAARGLAYAHGEGVVHRDLKPSNVFLTAKGVVKLLDFGMAHAFGRRRVSGGTPAYMAPEQWEENPEDERTDVFALGVMLHRMLTGEYPFPEDGGRWSSGPADPATLEVPGSPELGRLVGHCLQRVPKARPRDGAEVLAELEQIEKALPATAAGALPPRPTRKKASFAELLAELKRRRVFRVMAGYGIFAFAVLQVIEPIMHGAHLGDWVLTAVLVALAVGFPVAVILSWVFDFTAEGLVRTPKITGGPRLSRGRVAALLVGIGMLAALPGLGWYAWKHGREAVPAAETASIAVLPFADLSPNHDQDYFSDGVAEEILNALSHVNGLKVPGRASSFYFKGRNVELAEIAQKLGVTHLLEGTVRRDGQKLRIGAEVVRAADGDRVWSQSFDRDQVDVLAVQDEIARSVVTALAPRLVHGAVSRSPPRPPPNPEAYRLYLLGSALNNSIATPDALRRSVSALEQAVQLDPGFARAHASLGVHLMNLSRSSRDGDEMRRLGARARQEVARAQELDPGDATVQACHGGVAMGVDWDWAGAQADYDRAAALQPLDGPLLNGQAVLLHRLGRHAEAVAKGRQAYDLDPLNVYRAVNLAIYLRDAGALDEARAQLKRALELSPDMPLALEEQAEQALASGDGEAALAAYRRVPGLWQMVGVASALHTLGREAESLAAVRSLEVEHPDQPYLIACAYAWRGERDLAFRWLDRAFEVRDLRMLAPKVELMLRPVRGDPRFSAFLRRMNLPVDLEGTEAPPTAQAPSIAVLAFDDLSEKHDQGYFADGVAEEILNALAHVDGLRVPGRTSSFWFKGKNVEPAEIGRKLAVTHLLEGSVRRSGKRVRVTAQVVNVADGGHLWSETFERSEADIFAVQDEVAKAVAQALKVKLMRPSTTTRRAGQTINPEAYAQYLLGQHLYGLGTPEGYRQARDAYQRAIELDPTYAPPHARLGAVLRDVAYSGGGRPADLRSMRERGPAEVERAIQLGPELPEGYFTRSFFRLAFQLDFAGAAADAERAIALDPMATNGYRRRAQLLAARGKLDEAIAQMRRPTENDPLAVLNWNWLADFQIASGRLEDAETSLKRAFDLAPENDDARSHLATLRLLQGRPADALALAARLVQGRFEFEAMAHHALGHADDSKRALEALRREAGGTDQISLAEAYAWLGMPDRAFEALDHLGEEEYWGLRFNPLLAKLRGDSRWKPLLARLHLPVD